jgi:pimeloyl-ACP methyl ester carboxylesterase
MIPSSIFRVWFTGLLSFFLVGAGVYCIHKWYHRSWDYDYANQRSYFHPHLGFNHPTSFLAAAVVLFLLVVLGGLIVRVLFGILTKAKGSSVGKPLKAGTISRLGRPDGSELHVECYGPEDAHVIVLTHGWGADSTEWNYLKRDLGERFRLIAWDLPGIGRSTPPANQDYSLENLARDLQAVLGFAGARPAVLLGHSIGGMITLTLCKLFPQELSNRVSGLALVQTTYTNPVRTTSFASLLTAMEIPLIVPLLHLTIGLAPLVWLMNQLSYLNGSAHVSAISSGFAGTETWEQVEHFTRLGTKAWPAVMARGMFGMLRYDATDALKKITPPTLVFEGNLDPVCKPEASQRMCNDIPSAHLVVLKPAKHMGLIEHHQQFAEQVGQFASDLPLR